jgi:aspartyl-tRNA(Asn)/glutamyl-tRNA(Gln) amidotransferase subunit A
MMWSHRSLLEGKLELNRREFIAVGMGVSAAPPRSAASGTEFTSLTLSEAAEHMRRRTISPLDLTKACLERIEQVNPKLNAFITVNAQAAIAQAKELEHELNRRRWRGPLHGMPIALKDNIDTAGVKTTCASALFADRVPADDAEVVRRLKSAGGIILGKLNMHEFAHGTTSVISHYGPVRNPWNRDHIAGGSSGGSGAAVAARLCYGAVGTDTGASIRLPAACCGIVGLKPTYGLVSARGVVPDSWSFDHIGPMCRTATDAAIMLSAMAGYDPEDPASIESSYFDYERASQHVSRKLRLGRIFARETGDPDIAAVFSKAVGVLGRVAASVRDFELPPNPDLFASVADVEAFAFHAANIAKSPERYHPETRKELLVGQNVQLADYIQGRRDLDRIRRMIGRIFKDVDLLVLPTVTRAPLTVAECRTAFQYLGPTGAFNVYGLPTISVPCGFTNAGFPVGMQISGPRLGEAKVLALARAYQRLTDWHLKQPVI